MPFLNGTVGVIFREYAMGAAKANCASAKDTPCFSWFSLSFFVAHANRALTMRKTNASMAY